MAWTTVTVLVALSLAAAAAATPARNDAPPSLPLLQLQLQVRRYFLKENVEPLPTIRSAY